MTRGPVIPPGAEPTYARFHFAPAFRAGNIVFVSGVIGRGIDGQVPGDAADEFDAAFRQLAEVLAAAGMTMRDVVELTSYHTDLSVLRAFLEVKDRYVGEPYPAWTAVGVAALVAPGARVEIKATAVAEGT